LVTIGTTTPINVQGPAADALRSTPMPAAFGDPYVQVNVTGDAFELETASQPRRQMEVMLVWARHDSCEAETKTTNITVIKRRFIG
jgi:ribosomal protein L11